MSTQLGLAPSDPYVTPDPVPPAAVGGVLETTITADLGPIVSGTTTINAETYNGAIPGPTLRLSVGDTAIVRLINNLPYPTGIHWHGIELANSADGTEVTQKEVPGAPLQTLGNGVPAGGTYLYKFKVTRPGIFWYHPHHHNSTNRVFRGLYGMIVVTDPNEVALANGTVLPLPADTRQLVLSDITVCKAPGMNDTVTYPTAAGTEWLAGTPTIQAGATPPIAQSDPTPATLCQFPTAVDDDGATLPGPPAPPPYGAGDVPSLMTMAGRVNEGQTILTNGVNVGPRGGSPAAPAAVPLDATTYRLPVRRGQGLRLQIVNCATTRYFRLRLTDGAGQLRELVRVGGEGGVLNNAVLEGLTTVPMGTFNPEYESGEILLPPSVRADVVVAIPDTLPVGSVLTLWTRDFKRLGAGAVGGGGPWATLPTVPVMHLEVNADPPLSPVYAIAGGTPLRASLPPGPPSPLVETLGASNGSLLNPGTFVPPKPGDPAMYAPPGVVSDIRLTSGTPSVNGIVGHALHGDPPDPRYPNTLHIRSSRYAAAAVGRILELTVTNMTGAHHPFHLHGFSMQPKSLAPRTGAPPGTVGTFTWPYPEFRDSIDVPDNYTLTFRIRLDDRELVDGVTLGGWLGRWLFHCHIFFHHHRGMISELVVTNANGKERPYVDVGGSWAYVPSPGPTRQGIFGSPEGNAVTLAAAYGVAGAATLTATVAPVVTAAPVYPASPAVATPGNWSWTYPGGLANGTYYVYVTATDSTLGLQGQTVFRLKVGGTNDGSDVGDPHIRTVDGKFYDFQAVGEFTLLRDREGLEIQARQTPLDAASPITDSYSGLTASVSVNTAVAARVGSHRISYQPNEQGSDEPLQFFLDGKPAQLSPEGMDLEGHRVSAFDANGATGLRVDYAHGAVLTVAPRFWFLWFLDINVFHTQADEGIMGRIPDETWLPILPNGATVGQMPKDLHDRYVVLYKIFADAWRLTDRTSLFVYARGTSTETFTDRDWPAETPPSVLKPQFRIPGAPTPVNIPLAEAEETCKEVTMGDLHANCVFDVATTGDKGFAKAYLLQQELRLHGSTVQIGGDRERTRFGEPLVVTATVLPLTSGRPTPAGSVTFSIDNAAAGAPVKLDGQGRAQWTANGLSVGTHKIRASYQPEDANGYRPGTSPDISHQVEDAGIVGPESGCSPAIWIWILVILVLIVAALAWYFL